MTTTAARSEPTRTRVLIIDDDRKLCRLVKEYLEPMGYAVSAAHGGPEGLDLARVETFDAIILDGMLPGLDGFEVLKELRKTHDTRAAYAHRAWRRGGSHRRARTWRG